MGWAKLKSARENASWIASKWSCAPTFLRGKRPWVEWGWPFVMAAVWWDANTHTRSGKKRAEMELPDLVKIGRWASSWRTS